MTTEEDKRIIDLEGDLDFLEVQEETLSDLLNQTEDLDTYLDLEAELMKCQAKIEELTQELGLKEIEP